MRRVHGAFLEALKYRYERAEGRPINATQWFMILTRDPAYDWFRPFTQLMTEIDIVLEQERITEEDLSVIRQKVEKLFSTDDPNNHFALRFFEMMPQEPDVMFVYHHLREARKNF